MFLKKGLLLQGDKYKIERVLGQGGFGITYLAEQTSLGRKVAIKEFFIKELCNRDETTSHVSVGSEGCREMVTKFREKFVKEARNIACLEHPNIVSVIDVFEENGTAYYVMKYFERGSLAQLLKTQYPSGMPEAMALKYIREIASALDYIHKRSINHLDVKPANIMLNETGNAVLIDFGLAKQYDAETGQQTSSTPVGISEGYAPMEQYKKGGVGKFSPSTDIYSLGATFYKLITGHTPPDASTVNEEGLPPFQASDSLKAIIFASMQSRRIERPQSIDDWFNLLNNNMQGHGKSEDTIISAKGKDKPETKNSLDKKSFFLASLIAVVCIVLGILLYRDKGIKSEETENNTVLLPIQNNSNLEEMTDHTAQDSPMDSSPIIVDNTPAETEQKNNGYDVDFMCDVPSATLYINGRSFGSANKTHFLKLGTHDIKVTATGYKDYSGKISVNSPTKPYVIKMTKEPEPIITSAPTEDEAPIPQENRTIEANATIGSHKGHDWIDLGLPSGTKWATCNVGATSPSDYGSYFAWGEKNPRNSYDRRNLKYRYDTTEDKFSKYVTDSKYGNVDGKTELELGDDAAHVNWGSGWHIPSREQMDEMISNCTYTWTTMNGNSGYKITSKNNGNSIFLPAAGYHKGSSVLFIGSFGNYWTRSLDEDLCWFAHSLFFGPNDFTRHSDSGRRSWYSVRPVLYK